jgi:hypothetical protein
MCFRVLLRSCPSRLFNSLAALFATPILCFQQLARSFAKMPGGGGTPATSVLTGHQSRFLPALVFMGLQIPFPATLLFSYPYKSLGVSPSVSPPRTDPMSVGAVPAPAPTGPGWQPFVFKISGRRKPHEAFESAAQIVTARFARQRRPRIQRRGRYTGYSVVVRLWTCCSRAWLY